MAGQQAVGDQAEVAEHDAEILDELGGGAQHLLVIERHGAGERIALLEDRCLERAGRDVDDLVAQQPLGPDARFRVGADLFPDRPVDGERDQQDVVRVATLGDGDEFDPIDLAHVLAGDPHAGALDQAAGAGHQRDQLVSLAEHRARLADEEDRDGQDGDGGRDRDPHANLVPGYPRCAVHPPRRSPLSTR